LTFHKKCLNDFALNELNSGIYEGFKTGYGDQSDSEEGNYLK